MSNRDLFELQRLQLAVREEWEKHWPKHCPRCSGYGQISWEENQAPLGSRAYWPETFTDVCPQCVDQNRCPRCGADDPWPDTDEGANICKHCEYDLDNPDGLPQVIDLPGDYDEGPEYEPKEPSDD
jgi:hypothetical protein